MPRAEAKFWSLYLVYVDPTCDPFIWGNNVRISPYCSIGEPGFGFERDIMGYNKPLTRREHPYGVIIEDDVQLGSHTIVHRGRWRNTEIRRGAKIDAGVHIAHNDIIGEDVFIVAGSVIGGSVSIGNDCFIGENVSIKQGLKIVRNVTIGMGSVVTKSIDEYDTTWVGNPARKLYDKQVF